MVDFAGWLMPVNYGSQIEEHTAVRNDAGMFDVSHMTIIDVQGEQAEVFLRRIVANDVARLNLNQALYGALLNEQAGVLDDLIVYRLAEGFRCVVNASTRDKVLAWMQQNTLPGAHFEHKPQVMIAVQGPNAIQRLQQVEVVSGLADLEPFYAMQYGSWRIGRTGYTGEDGGEVMLPEADGVNLWRKLREAVRGRVRRLEREGRWEGRARERVGGRRRGRGARFSAARGAADGADGLRRGRVGGRAHGVRGDGTGAEAAGFRDDG